MRDATITPTSWRCLLCSLLIAGCFSEPTQATPQGSSGTTSGSSGGTTQNPTTANVTTTDAAETTGASTSSGGRADSTGKSSVSTTLDPVADSSSTGSESTGEQVDPSLVLWLQFEDDLPRSGGAMDSTRNGLDATCSTVCPTQTEGPPGHGSAVLFSGTEILRVGDATELQLTEAVSVAAWVRLDAIPTNEYAVVVGRESPQSGFNVYDIYYQQSVSSYFVSVANQTSPAASTAVGDWVHIAGTWSANSSILRIYLNGEAQGTTDAPSLPVYPDADLLIGSDLSGGGDPFLSFPGAIDDLRIYDRELSPDEVTALAQ